MHRPIWDLFAYCIYLINLPGCLLNFRAFRVGGYSRWVPFEAELNKFSPFSASNKFVLQRNNKQSQNVDMYQKQNFSLSIQVSLKYLRKKLVFGEVFQWYLIIVHVIVSKIIFLFKAGCILTFPTYRASSYRNNLNKLY